MRVLPMHISRFLRLFRLKAVPLWACAALAVMVTLPATGQQVLQSALNGRAET